MSIYPVELSSELNELIESAKLNSALSLSNTNTEQKWIKAIALLENGKRAEAIALFDELKQVDDPFGLASQIELILMQPIAYFNDRILIKKLKKTIPELPKQRLLARLFHGLAILMLWQRNTPQALNNLLQSRDIYRELKEQEGLARILDSLGNVNSAMADHEQALLYYTESLALKTKLGDTKGQALTLGNLGRLCMQLGRFQQARSFVELDLDLIITEENTEESDEENDEIKARLYNLLARIDIADQKWDSAKEHLQTALELLDDSQHDSLFFCIKDQIHLALCQEYTEGVDAKIAKIEELLPENSNYHKVHLGLVKNSLAQLNKSLSMEQAEQLLEDIEYLEIPELELEARIELARLSISKGQNQTAQQHLLLARKLAKMAGIKRFLPQINSLMIQFDIHENINEETIRPISDNIKNVDDGYLTRKRLGGGGFGDVFLAHDMVNDRDVAIKRFHAGDLLDHRLQKKRWNQARLEFEAVASLTHPSIAKVYAIGHDSTGSPYLVQEFITGGDISKLMSQSNDLRTALSYLLPITRALAATHDIGIIHRDIKPENILVNKQGITVLVDFGIALLKHDKIESDSIQGTEYYIAPEQRLSTDIDLTVDLFSLGCVLYEWISDSKVDITENKTNKLISFLGFNQSERITEIDKDVCGIAYTLITRLLAYDAKDRPSSASEVADEMQQLLQNL